MKQGLLNNKNAQKGAEKRDARINLRVEPSDKAAWKNAANSRKMTLAAWIEETLNANISKEDKGE